MRVAVFLGKNGLVLKPRIHLQEKMLYRWLMMDHFQEKVSGDLERMRAHPCRAYRGSVWWKPPSGVRGSGTVIESMMSCTGTPRCLKGSVVRDGGVVLKIERYGRVFCGDRDRSSSQGVEFESRSMFRSLSPHMSATGRL